MECGDLRGWQVLSMFIRGKVIRHVAAAPFRQRGELTRDLGLWP